MVRINCGIESSALADQHLIAEYREVLLAFGYYKKNPHIESSDNNLMNPLKFYKDKLLYLEKRFNSLKEEMILRGFKPLKSLEYNGLSKDRFNDWEPKEIHIKRIKDRIIQRLNEKPTWYRYYGEYKYPEFFTELIK